MNRGAGRVLTGIGLAFALVMIASGTMTLVSLWWLRHDVDHQTLTATQSVRFYSDCGSITVQGAQRSDIGLTSTIWWTFTKPTVEASVVDGIQVVQVSCAALSFGAANSANVVLDVPAATDVTVRNSAGAVTLRGLSGPVDAQSDGGAIDGAQLRSASIKASTSAGAVRLSFSTAPETVTAHSSGGSVTVLLPQGTESYHVVANSSGGSTDVKVKTDPDSTRTVTATSSAGRVLVDYVG